MGRSNNSFIKKQKADRRVKRKKEKMEERLERKEQTSSGKLEDMIAYIDEFGNISDTPPEEPVPAKKNKDSKESKEPHNPTGNQN
ncbi:MAG: cold-shock protein [Anditalea sp.]